MRIVDLVPVAALPVLVGLTAALLRTDGPRPDVLGGRTVAGAALGTGLVAAAGTTALDRTAVVPALGAGLAIGLLTAFAVLGLHRVAGRPAAGVGLAICSLLTVGGLTQVRLLQFGHVVTAFTYGTCAVVLLVGAAAAARAWFAPHSGWAVVAWVGVALLLLPLLPGLGLEINGARAWIAIGPSTFQPAEVARPLLVVGVALALFEAGPEVRGGTARAAVVAAAPVACGIGLLALLHRDLGPALVLGLTTVALTLLLRPPRRILLGLTAIVVGAASLAYLLVDRVQERVEVWLVPVHSDGAAENTGAALQAMARGGAWGTGLGRGRPDVVRNAHNDFILSAVTEERGLVGVLCVVVLLALVCLHLLARTDRARDAACHAALLGLALMTAVHALYVVLASVGAVPLTGIVVPFVSAGGSALLSGALVVGVVVGATAARNGPPTPVFPTGGTAVLRRALATCWVVALVGAGLVVLDSPVPSRRPASVNALADRGRLVASDGTVLAMTSAGTDGRLERVHPLGDDTASVLGELTRQGAGRGLDRATSALGACTPPVLDELLGIPCPPRDVVLSLDPSVQQAAGSALAGATGEIVALDVRDFSVLADHATPGEASEGSHTTERTAAPGSTFKLVVAAAALEAGVPTDTPRRTGYTPEGGVGTVPNFDDTVCGGSLDQSIATSCNTAFAEVAGRVGADRLAATARAFGFGSEGLTEDVPLVASSVGDGLEDPDALARTGIGQQDVRATTMQMAVVAATIAAGGLGRTVRHVRGRCEDGRLAAVPEPEPRRVVSEPTARAITDGMRAAVRSGTARRLQQVDEPVAAKTGTAQTGRGTDDAWLVAFAPVDTPRVAVAVHILGTAAGDPTGGREAAQAAVSVLDAALTATSVRDRDHSCDTI